MKALLIVVAAVCLACGPAAEFDAAGGGTNGVTVIPCGPETCGGCCDASGVCREGTAQAACGTGGGLCIECQGNNACGPEGTCVGVDSVAPNYDLAVPGGRDKSNDPGYPRHCYGRLETCSS